jgi:Rrf2 family protein
MIGSTWGTTVGYFAARCAAAVYPEFVRATDVAKRGRLAFASVHRVMRELRRRGILQSSRGKGYRLARPAAEVSVYDVLSALEGPALSPLGCNADSALCQARARCPFLALCTGVRERLHKELKRLTLDRLPVDETGSPECLKWRVSR